MKQQILRLLLGLLLLAGLLNASACQAPAFGRSWRAGDLRLLDAPDAAQPALDLLAAYARSTVQVLELRFDLLDIQPGDDGRILVRIWDEGDLRTEPLVVEAAPSGALSWRGPSGTSLRPRLVWDFDLDTLVVSLNRVHLRGRVRFEASTLLAGRSVDQLGPVESNATPPAGRAALVLAFTDSFPALTPAQALRRWDGAHTGPTGERHGLRHVLDAASRYHLPVFLLDLKTPSSLAALQAIGQTRRLMSLSAAGLVVLPDVAWSEPGAIALQLSRQSAAGFGLHASPYVYAASGLSQPGSAAQFLPLEDPRHLGSSGGQLLIPLPEDRLEQATPDGPGLDLRRALVESALSADDRELLVLGGSLPSSTWGDSDMAGPTFAWLAGHPWVRVLSGIDLLTFSATRLAPQTDGSTPAADAWLGLLEAAPENALTAGAWQAYLNLTAPSGSQSLQSLRSVYLGQIGILLAGAAWAEAPRPLADCRADLDLDGQVECQLSDGGLLAVFESNGALLSHLFLLAADGPHQLIAPSSQFAVGLSDPSEWHPEGGPSADPSVLPGAFAELTDTWLPYQPELIPGGVRFRALDGTRTKTYLLGEAGLSVTYETDLPTSTRILLAVEAQAFFSRPLAYQAVLGQHSFLWGADTGIAVELSSQALLYGQGFSASRPYLFLPESPDLTYPAGHYLPYPLALVRLESGGDFTVELRVR